MKKIKLFFKNLRWDAVLEVLALVVAVPMCVTAVAAGVGLILLDRTDPLAIACAAYLGSILVIGGIAILVCYFKHWL